MCFFLDLVYDLCAVVEKKKERERGAKTYSWHELRNIRGVTCSDTVRTSTSWQINKIDLQYMRTHELEF